jgi:hypothetical protein
VGRGVRRVLDGCGCEGDGDTSIGIWGVIFLCVIVAAGLDIGAVDVDEALFTSLFSWEFVKGSFSWDTQSMEILLVWRECWYSISFRLVLAIHFFSSFVSFGVCIVVQSDSLFHAEDFLSL